ncbi:hypothetical protein GUITHDRAFT_99063 [Guillardia theta CCMP2712]|uniref:Sulfotransferase domain-containing protein n=1 Tax=Guillardia theta (strain CCMP2712) TaxID=905079 RepID=L1K3Z7_GUITC|nr:hypothetical protein GUITHDRAFT_99063 [Guillardia theta CCMP2712]EKX55282.1 hypothetical protein GUITHDRAFT_99063 [Guillardia theta CCMP2712]|eukprot:XP_005842262.1 hypothetical protein GUITHDRAFT_99063 [Guillardia theta CCMP2712]
MGGFMPPPFDREPFEPSEFASWTRPGDLIISPAPKSGTTWMLYCSHQIRAKGLDEDFYDVSVNTPWIGWRHKPGQKWSELKELMNTTILDNGKNLREYWDNASYPFRIFKSHFGPVNENGTEIDVLPVKEFPHVKFLAMLRNGKDIVSSLDTFFSNFRPEYRKMWGGYPFVHKTRVEALKDFLPEGVLGSVFFGYAKSWWKFRHEKNVLLLHYADMKRNPVGGVKRLAEFLEVELNEEELNRVVHKCSIEHMKQHEEKFNYLLWANPSYNGSVMCGKDRCAGITDGSLIQQGRIGEGHKWFTEDMLKLWDEAVEREFPDPEMRQWIEDGGDF